MKSPPRRAKTPSATATTAMLNRRERKSPSGSMGWPHQCSHTTNPPITTMPTSRPAEHERGRPPAVWTLDDRPQDQTEATHGEDRAERIGASGVVVMGLGDEQQGPDDSDRHDR